MVPLVLRELWRKWWQVYVDNWDAGTVGPWPETAKLVGVPDERQLAVRKAWEESGVPRSVDKSVEEEIDEAIDYAEKSSSLTLEGMYEDIYQE